MKRINTFNTMLVIVVSVILLLTSTGCGTSYTVKQPLEATSMETNIYAMGSCKIQDNRMYEDLSNVLQEQVRYGLFKKGLYEKNGSQAPREVNLTITYFRNVETWPRAILGMAAGKDGLDVTVDVVNRQNKEIVGRAVASYYNITVGASNTDKSVVNKISKKIVEFLASGKSK